MTIREKIENIIYFQHYSRDYNDCGWELDSSKDIFIDEKNNLKFRFAIIENSDVCLYLLNDEYVNGENPLKLNSEVEYEGKNYCVKYIYLRCKKWNLDIPETVKEIYFDRNSPDPRERNKTFRHGDSTNSLFNVDERNKYLCSIDGSLYSRDKKILYHWYVKSKLATELTTINPWAIYIKNNSSSVELIIPKGVSEIHKMAISGYISKIDFQGKLTKIEEDSINVNNVDIKINGLLEDLSPDSRINLKQCSKNVIFAAPNKLPNKKSTAGYIHLAGVIDTNWRPESRLDYDKDYKDVILNAYINESIGYSRVPILVEEQLMEKMYVPVKGSRIFFFAKDENNKEGIPYIDVFENPNVVEQKIKEAIDSKR